MSKKVKKTRIAEERARLLEQYADIPQKKKQVLMGAIDQAAFMKIELEDLTEKIMKEGCSEHYQNGKNQSGIKQSAAVQAYNGMLRNYTSVINLLVKAIPIDKSGSSSKLMDFAKDFDD